MAIIFYSKRDLFFFTHSLLAFSPLAFVLYARASSTLTVTACVCITSQHRIIASFYVSKMYSSGVERVLLLAKIEIRFERVVCVCVLSLRSNFCCSNNMPTSTGRISSLTHTFTHSAQLAQIIINSIYVWVSVCVHFVELKAEELSHRIHRKWLVLLLLPFCFSTFDSSSSFPPSNASNKSKINPICYLNRLELVFVRRSFGNVVSC